MKQRTVNTPITRRGALDLATLFLATTALATVPFSATAGDAGGQVGNILPVIELFTSDPLPTEQNEGENGLLLGTVRDQNGEADIIKLHLALGDGPSGATAVNSDAPLGSIPTEKPASFTSGWKVWDPTANDGRLSFEYQYFYLANTPGTYAWELEVEDEEGMDDATLDVIVAQRITITDDPVNPDGTLDVGAAWGNWLALPGAVDVQAVNYLKVQNTGNAADQQFVLDFTPAPGLLVKSFVGDTDASEEITIEGNVQFAFWEGNEDDTPADGTFAYMTTDADGGHTFEFTGLDKVIFIRYQLPVLPEVLSEQDYGASYTVTAL